MTAMRELAERSKQASKVLALATTAQKNRALTAMAKALRADRSKILKANLEDLTAAAHDGEPEAFLDRLKLDAARLEQMADAVTQVTKLPDPIGTETARWRRPNGLRIKKVRLPLGVVMLIFEARPNVTSDAASLCLKSGNAVILRGGSESLRSNQAIAAALHRGLKAAKLPADCIQLVPTIDRAAMLELISFEGLIDLCIPRGGEGLIRFVVEHARVPVVKHYQGVCHVYVHRDANLEMAERIIVNAKTSRPGVCNAAECLLVDAKIAAKFLPHAAAALIARGVELRADERAVALLNHAALKVTPATPEDFGREFLSLILAVKIVDGLDGALQHIARYGSEHTEAIVTQSKTISARFEREVMASAVVVNASTRFNDGGELGLGAEVGISTSRLHAFGPMGLNELTSQKYVVEGRGQVR